jgi:hypothetical protein
MTDAVYCLTASEPKANAILTRLRGMGLGSEISVLLESNVDTRNISVKEDAVRGATIGGIVGALAAFTLPGIGAILAVGPLATILTALTGAFAGGAVGGLVGGSGALEPLGLPREVEERLHDGVSQGDILIAVHSADPITLRRAARVFRMEEAEYIYDRTEGLAA